VPSGLTAAAEFNRYQLETSQRLSAAGLVFSRVHSLLSQAEAARDAGDVGESINLLLQVLNEGESLLSDPATYYSAAKIYYRAFDAIGAIVPESGLLPEHRVGLIEALAAPKVRAALAAAVEENAEALRGFSKAVDEGAIAEDLGVTPGASGPDWIYGSGFGEPFRRRDRDASLVFLDEFREKCTLPHAQSVAWLDGLCESRQGLIERLHPMFIETARTQLDLTANIEAMLALARVGLAIENHRDRTGAWPATMEPLAAEFPDGIPLDPFTRKPFKYRADVGKFTLYSVGTNLTDDGGRHDLRDGDIVWRGVNEEEVEITSLEVIVDSETFSLDW
jgi:hypothetical protein